jgi:hypothetical protein
MNKSVVLSLQKSCIAAIPNVLFYCAFKDILTTGSPVDQIFNNRFYKAFVNPLGDTSG